MSRKDHYKRAWDKLPVCAFVICWVHHTAPEAQIYVWAMFIPSAANVYYAFYGKTNK